MEILRRIDMLQDNATPADGRLVKLLPPFAEKKLMYGLLFKYAVSL